MKTMSTFCIILRGEKVKQIEIYILINIRAKISKALVTKRKLAMVFSLSPQFYYYDVLTCTCS